MLLSCYTVMRSKYVFSTVAFSEFEANQKIHNIKYQIPYKTVQGVFDNQYEVQGYVLQENYHSCIQDIVINTVKARTNTRNPRRRTFAAQAVYQPHKM